MPAKPPAREVPRAALEVAKLHSALLREAGVYADPEQRVAAAAILDRFPGVRAHLQAARRAHCDAALNAVTRGGAKGVVFGAAGYPDVPYPHALALAAVPSARFCYCSMEPRITLYNEAELGGPNVAACHGSLMEPAELLALPQVAGIGGPLCVMACLAPHYWPADLFAHLMGEYARLLPAGSILVMTVLILDRTRDGGEFAAALAEAGGAPVQAHTPESVRSWVSGAGMRVRRGDVTDARAYGRPWAERSLPRLPPARIAVVTARKPRRGAASAVSRLTGPLPRLAPLAHRPSGRPGTPPQDPAL